MSISHAGIMFVAGSALAALIAAGCNKAAGPVASSKNSAILVIDSAKTAPPAAPNPAAPAADQFLMALTSGDTKAALTMVAVSFRKELSGPLTFEEEKKLGYSDSDTEKYLKAAAEGAQKAEVRTQHLALSGNAASFRGKLNGMPGKLFSLRLAKEGEVWRVTRFIAGRILGTGAFSGDQDPELAWARETALDFLDALIGSNDEHLPTMLLMTEEFKAKRPSPSIHDEGLTYAKKDVRAWLNGVRKGADGYVATRESRTPQGFAFAGDLAEASQNRPFTVFLVRRGDDWKVNDFDVKQ